MGVFPLSPLKAPSPRTTSSGEGGGWLGCWALSLCAFPFPLPPSREMHPPRTADERKTAIVKLIVPFFSAKGGYMRISLSLPFLSLPKEEEEEGMRWLKRHIPAFPAYIPLSVRKRLLYSRIYTTTPSASTRSLIIERERRF